MPHRLPLLPMTCALPTVKSSTTKSRPNRANRVLTDEQASNLQMEYKRGGISTAQLGHKYGVSQQVAHRIATGRMYADLPTAPKPNRVPWVDPKVRYRGCPSEAELRVLKTMLREYPDRWALIKRVKTLPVGCETLNAIESWGLITEARREADGWYGLYVCFPAGLPVASLPVVMAVA